MGGQWSTPPQPLYLRQGYPGWDRRPVWTGTEILAAIGVRSPNVPAQECTELISNITSAISDEQR